jgi:Endoribonuclease L-PSP
MDLIQQIRSGNVDKLTFSNPSGLYDPRPNAYSHLAVFPAGWRIILPAGQGGETEDGVLSEDFATQVRQALTNTETVLAASGATMADVAKFNPADGRSQRGQVRRHTGGVGPSVGGSETAVDGDPRASTRAERHARRNRRDRRGAGLARLSPVIAK